MHSRTFQSASTAHKGYTVARDVLLTGRSLQLHLPRLNKGPRYTVHTLRQVLVVPRLSKNSRQRCVLIFEVIARTTSTRTATARASRDVRLDARHPCRRSRIDALGKDTVPPRPVFDVGRKPRTAGARVADLPALSFVPRLPVMGPEV